MTEREELVKRLDASTIKDFQQTLNGVIDAHVDGTDFGKALAKDELGKICAQAIAALSAQPAQEPDAAHLQTIDERDAAEEAVSDIYYRITGRSPEWSNLFGFEQAIDEIQDAFDLVRAVAKSNTAPTSCVRDSDNVG